MLANDSDMTMVISEIKWAFKLFVLLAIALFLHGCYLSDIKALTSGEQVPFTGRFSCKDMFGKESKDTGNDNVREVSSGIPFFKSYEYHSDDSVVTFSKVKKSLYLAQMEFNRAAAKKNDGKFGYMYFDFFSPNSFSIMVANIMSAGSRLDAMANDRGLSSEKSAEPGMFKLSGSSSNLKAFLKNHELGMLMTVMTCSRK